MIDSNLEINIRINDNLFNAISEMQKALDEQDRLKAQNNIDSSSQNITSTIPSQSDEAISINVKQSINKNENHKEETTLKLTQKNT